MGFQAVLDEPKSRDRTILLSVLGTCLADEAAARPETIRAALRVLVRSGSLLENAVFTPALAKGRYGADLREEARRAFFAQDPDLENSGTALIETVWWQTSETMDAEGYTHVAKRLLELLNSFDSRSRCEGALGFVQLCFALSPVTHKPLREGFPEALRHAGVALMPMLFSAELQEQYAASFALIWLGACRVWQPPEDPDMLGRLFTLWRSRTNHLDLYAARALASQPVASREDGRRCASVPVAELEEVFYMLETDGPVNPNEKVAILTVSWYLHALDDAQVAQRARALLKDFATTDPVTQTLYELLKHLGEEEL